MPDKDRTSPECRTVEPDEADRALATILLAFGSDPAARWSYPDPRDYLRYFPDILRAFGGAAFTCGTAYQAGDFAGAALWLPPGVRGDEAGLESIFRASVPPERQDDLFRVFEGMASHHPKEPHWFLPLIGVDPRCQGKGLGSALMRHALERCDEDHLPAYLESSNPANIPLYERHGFVVLDKLQSGSSPTIVPMLRAAR